MNEYHISNVQWDFDDEDDYDETPDVPTEFDIEIPDDEMFDDEEETISDFITEKYGWLHKGFTYERI